MTVYVPSICDRVRGTWMPLAWMGFRKYVMWYRSCAQSKSICQWFIYIANICKWSNCFQYSEGELALVMNILTWLNLGFVSYNVVVLIHVFIVNCFICFCFCHLCESFQRKNVCVCFLITPYHWFCAGWKRLSFENTRTCFFIFIAVFEVGLVTHTTRLNIDLVCWIILWKSYKMGAILHNNSTKK